jgi:hypothetical protein
MIAGECSCCAYVLVVWVRSLEQASQSIGCGELDPTLEIEDRYSAEGRRRVRGGIWSRSGGLEALSNVRWVGDPKIYSKMLGWRR